jgi:hypothetical protein
VQPAQAAFFRARVIILDELGRNPGLGKFLRLESLHEETTLIAKDFRLN